MKEFLLSETPPKSPLSSEDFTFYYNEGPERVKRQYGGVYLPLVDFGEPISAISIPVKTALEYVTKPISEETADFCEEILDVVGTWLKPECIKKVRAACLFTHIGSKGRETQVTTLGVNGWNPPLIPSARFNWEESEERINRELSRLGVPISSDRISQEIQEFQEQASEGKGLSCTAIDTILRKLGARPEEHYCRMNLHRDREARLTNDDCPSSLYCAEGSANFLRPAGILLAKLLEVEQVTVIEAKLVGRNLLAVTFVPVGPTESYRFQDSPWTLITNVDVRGSGEGWAALNTSQALLPYNVQTLSDLSSSEGGLMLRVRLVGRDVVRVGMMPGASIDEFLEAEEAEALPFEKRFELKLADYGTQTIENTAWILDYTPCPRCASVKLSGQSLTGYVEDRRSEAILIRQLSRHGEVVDAGDILPLTSLLLDGIRIARFGRNLPPPKIQDR